MRILTIAGDLYMKRKNYAKLLERTNSFAEIFEVVQEVVDIVLDDSRAGLDLGLMELGNNTGDWLGGYYPVGSNIIVMNKTPLRRIKDTNPEMMKPYVFMVLLHEYLHSLGYTDEEPCRELTYRICNTVFGEEHLSTEMSVDITKYISYLSYPDGQLQIDKDMEDIEIVPNFDRNADYYIG